MSLIIPALSFRQRKVQMYLATVPVAILDAFYIDIWNPKNVMGRRGYQRKPDPRRVKSIAKYFEWPDAIMPVAGLLNVREEGQLKFQNGRLTIPDGTGVWVVDMQHRLKGLVQAREDHVLRGNFEFPVVITEGLSQVDEAAQFYVINTKAKKMDVALTRRLLIENDRIRDIADVKPWEIAAVRITIELNKSLSSNPWFGKIREPNEDRLEEHVATEKSFVSSLRQLLIAGKFKQPRKAARRLATYWRAISEIIPEAFREPKRYLVQRTPGIFVFNFFLAPGILAKYTDDQFADTLKRLKKLGPEFWRRSNKRGARRFGTGMGGYANLADHIRKYIR